MEIKFKINDSTLKNVEANVRRSFDKVIRNEKMLNEVGEVVVTDIVTQTRNEKSIPLKADLKLLKDKWITRKSKLSKNNKVHPDYEEGKSNLTFTGQLLDSLKWKIQGVGRISLYFKGIHRPYNNGDGYPQTDSNLTNAKLAEYVSKDRPFVGVRPAIRLRINRIVRTYLKRALVVARLSDNAVDK